MIVHFFLVRHGETELNQQKIIQGWRDSPLTQEGIRQASTVAAQLPKDISMMFSSDLGRAQQTAEGIVSQLPATTLLLDWRLRERSFGEMEGLPSDKEQIDKTFTDSRASYRGAEPVDHVNERIKSFVRDCSNFESDTFIVVTHNGIMNRFCYLFVDDYQHVRYENAAVLQLSINLDDPRLAPTTQPIRWQPPSLGK